MGFLRKLKFWSRRDVKDDIQKHTEALEKTLEEREATVTISEEKLKERNIKSEQVEATLRSRISELEEVEAALRGHIKHLNREATDPEAFKELEKLQESDGDRKNEEPAHRRYIKALQNKLEETGAGEQQLDGQINCLYNKIKEKDCDRASMGAKLRCKIRDLEELQETDILKKEAESALCGQRVYYLRKQEERDVREQTEVVLNDRIDKPHKQILGSWIRASFTICMNVQLDVTYIGLF
jgi:chromosome segregation ATPase